MKKYTKTLVLTIGLLCGNFAMAQALLKTSMEYKQLEAMGYDIKPQDEKTDYTVADNGSYDLIFTKNSERVAIVNSYPRKQITDKEEAELLKIVNKINTETAYQVSFGDKYIAFTLYIFGPYDPKTFAKVVRHAERAERNFNDYPRLAELIEQ